MNRAKSHSRTKTIALYSHERRLVYVSSLCFLIALFAYVYFIFASVSDVVMRKSIDVHIASRQKDINALEVRYIQAKERISQDDITMRGFAKAEHKSYITRSSSNLVLVRNDES